MSYLNHQVLHQILWSCHFLRTITMQSRTDPKDNEPSTFSRVYALRKFVMWMRALTALSITCLSDTFGGIITIIIIIIISSINIKINLLTLVLLFFTVINAVYHYPSTSLYLHVPSSSQFKCHETLQRWTCLHHRAPRCSGTCGPWYILPLLVSKIWSKPTTALCLLVHEAGGPPNTGEESAQISRFVVFV